MGIVPVVFAIIAIQPSRSINKLISNIVKNFTIPPKSIQYPNKIFILFLKDR